MLIIAQRGVITISFFHNASVNTPHLKLRLLQSLLNVFSWQLSIVLTIDHKAKLKRVFNCNDDRL